MGLSEQSTVASSTLSQREAASWSGMSPLAQAILTISSHASARTTRVEHLLMALLFRFEGESSGWLQSYKPEDRQAAAEGARVASGRAALVLSKLGVDVEKLQRDVFEATRLEPPRDAAGAVKYSRDLKRVWALAFEEARLMGSALVWPEHLVLAILRWSRPRAPWSVWPLRHDRALQVLVAPGLDINVARVVVREMLSSELEEPSPWTVRVQKAVDEAHQLSIKTQCGRISAPHLLLALLRDDEDARAMFRHLQLENVDLARLRQELRAGIRGDGEASTARPRFSKDAVRALDKCKAMSASAGLKRMDEAALLLSLALHGGESAAAWRQVLVAERASEQVKRLYSRPVSAVALARAQDDWSWKPRGALNWAAFLTTPVAWPIGFGLASQVARSSLLFWVAMLLIFLPLGWLLASVFALLLGRPPAFKNACISFLSGFGLVFMMLMLGSMVWNSIRAMLGL